MDNASIVIIAFIILFGISASIIAMGAIPKIFQSAEDLRQTGQNLNSTEQGVKVIKSEVFSQRPIVKDANKTVNLLNQTFYNFVKDELDRNEKLQVAETQLSIAIANVTTEIRNISIHNQKLINTIIEPLLNDLTDITKKMDLILSKINITTTETQEEVTK